MRTVATSSVDWNLIISLERGGKYCIWKIENSLEEVKMNAEIKLNTNLKDPIDINPATCLVCSPKNADHAAVGHENGQVVIIDVEKRVSLMRMAGHTAEIWSLSWAPSFLQLSSRLFSDSSSPLDALQHGSGDMIKSNDEGEEEETAFDCLQLLLSCSKDRSMRIWNAEEGLCLHSTQIPTSQKKGGGGGGGGGGRSPFANGWCVAHWSPFHPLEFFSTGFNGELFCWSASSGLDPSLSLDHSSRQKKT